MLKLADHDVRDGGFDFDRQTMLKAGSETKADKDAATAALRAVRKITESRDDNDAKPEVVEHTGRKERKEGPFTRVPSAAQLQHSASSWRTASWKPMQHSAL
jgi:hypothetical protein